MCEEHQVVRLADRTNKREIRDYQWVLLSQKEMDLVNEYPQVYVRVVLQQFYQDLQDPAKGDGVLLLLASFLDLFGCLPLRLHQNWAKRYERDYLVTIWDLMQSNDYYTPRPDQAMDRTRRDIPAGLYNRLPSHIYEVSDGMDVAYAYYGKVATHFRALFIDYANKIAIDYEARVDQENYTYLVRLFSKDQVFHIRLAFKLSLFWRFEAAVQQLHALYIEISPGIQNIGTQFMESMGANPAAMAIYSQLLFLYLYESPFFPRVQPSTPPNPEEFKTIYHFCELFLRREGAFWLWQSPAARQRDLDMAAHCQLNYQVLAQLPDHWRRFLSAITIIQPPEQLCNGHLINLWIDTMRQFASQQPDGNFDPEVSSEVVKARNKIIWFSTVVRRVKAWLDSQARAAVAGGRGGGGGAAAQHGPAHQGVTGRGTGIGGGSGGGGQNIFHQQGQQRPGGSQDLPLDLSGQNTGRQQSLVQSSHQKEDQTTDLTVCLANLDL